LPAVTYTKNILITSRLHNGQLAIMVVNKVNEPVSTSIRVPGLNSGVARVLFENRLVSIKGGIISDQISAYGSQVYLINLKAEKQDISDTGVNLVTDGGFEDLSGPGLPSACYARPGGDRGATYFLDSREYFSGNHSLRIITPQENKSLAIRFFPFYVKAGSSYTITIRARSDPEQRDLLVTIPEKSRLYNEKGKPQYVEIMLGDFAKSRFVPDNEWKEYMTFVTIPADTLARFKTNLILRMPGKGVAWFDEVKVTEDNK